MLKRETEAKRWHCLVRKPNASGVVVQSVYQRHRLAYSLELTCSCLLNSITFRSCLCTGSGAQKWVSSNESWVKKSESRLVVSCCKWLALNESGVSPSELWTYMHLSPQVWTSPQVGKTFVHEPEWALVIYPGMTSRYVFLWCLCTLV